MGAAIALSEPAARDPAVVGGKAAGLALAAAASLPVLSGRVLPVEASRAAAEAGATTLRRSGLSAAYLAATGARVDPEVERAMADLAAPPAQSWVVRSSTSLDHDGRWSGAFPSYLDLGAGVVPSAVRGCWASAFSRDVAARCAETGVRMDDIRIGVLAQPFVAFEIGGTARVGADGTVALTAAPSGPMGVVTGGRAAEVTVGEGGARATASPSAEPHRTMEAAAALARRAAEATGIGVIEWGAVADSVVLLQVGPAPPVTAPPATEPVAAGVPAGAERLARLVVAFPGPLGEELILPWAFGADEPPEADRVEVADPAAALVEASALARRLAAAAWATHPDVAMERATAASRLLREGRVVDGLGAIRDLCPPDARVVGRLLGLVAWVGEALATRGALPSGSLVWRHTVKELECLIAGGLVAPRRGPDRWEPFVAEVIRARGRRTEGTGVVGGIGAGRAHIVPSLGSIGRPSPRLVLMAQHPLPQLSPLLWHCAGLVAASGSTGAHLFEVARSLGVPTVVGVHGAEAVAEASLVAVDGEAGAVSFLPAAGAAVDPSTREGGTVSSLVV